MFPIYIAFSAVILLLTLLFLKLCRGARNRRLRIFQSFVEDWASSHREANELYKKLSASGWLFALPAPQFTGESLKTFDQVREQCAIFLALRQALNYRLAQSEQIYRAGRTALIHHFTYSHIRRARELLAEGQIAATSEDLDPGLFPGLIAPARRLSLAASDLPRQLLSARDAASVSFFRLTSYITFAQSTQQAIDADLSGTGPQSLISLIARLKQLELPVAVYTDRVDDVTGRSATLSHCLQIDPLKDWSSDLSSVRLAVETLRQWLSKVCDVATELKRVRCQYDEVEQRIDQLRATPVPSILPGAQPVGTFTLNEEGYSPSAALAEAAQLLRDADQNLHEDRLDRAIEQYTTSVAAIASAEELTTRALNDKAKSESALAWCASIATEADQLAEAEEMRCLQELYCHQRWCGLLPRVQRLEALYQERNRARSRLQALVERFAAVWKELDQRQDVLSPAVSAHYLTLVPDLRKHKVDAARGRNDWTELLRSVEALTQKLAGEDAGSVVAQMRAELALYEGCQSSLAGLRQALSDLTTRVSEGWGGATAALKLQQVTPAVTAELAKATTFQGKDWSCLQQLLADASALLQPAQDLVDEQLGLDYQWHSESAAFESDLSIAANRTYSRKVSGKGASSKRVLSLGLVESRQSLAKAQAAMGGRDYATALKELRHGRAQLLRSDLECCWFFLEMLSLCRDTSVQQYAMAQGYCDGGFESWCQSQRQSAADGSLLVNIPPIPVAIQQALDNTALASRVPDPPAVKDYE